MAASFIDGRELISAIEAWEHMTIQKNDGSRTFNVATKGHPPLQQRAELINRLVPNKIRDADADQKTADSFRVHASDID
jgi:hypothetical protein